jgi:hypothetical protein
MTKDGKTPISDFPVIPAGFKINNFCAEKSYLSIDSSIKYFLLPQIKKKKKKERARAGR